MAQNGKLRPNLDQQSTKLLNLTVLQRIDPFIDEILITATHVTFYEFNTDLSEWECSTSVSVYCDESPEYWILGAYSKVSSTKSEFEELEAVPTIAFMDGPLEPSSSTACIVTDVPDDPAFVNFFSTATTIVNSSTTTITGQPYQPSSTISLPSHPVGVAPSPIPSMQISSATLAPFLDIPESHSNTKLVNNLVKPSSFFVPPSSSPTSMPRVSSSVPTAPHLHPAVSLQRPYGAPLLQPFPPPAPPPSLTPASFPILNCGPVNRDKVRNALMLLVQDNHFIDMVYGALLNAHHS
ncbi:mRNA-decapping enzyme-like protein isoform X3 [Prunus dulcis]|uniref:mRNA-decapping enzyme-like protein isoform X3 n=1 Tax=Prunus dulcis TaxID=3755 RepID=UPI001483AA78|nr:mRNA-decapping enzyme-like protein isoform X3 [Prunus dulcis]